MSILDNEIDLVDSIDVLIRSFIENNYDIIGYYTIKDNIVDVEGGVRVKNYVIKSLTNGLFSFGVVDRSFFCGYCPSLTSLEGAPEKVGENFYCGNCKSLKSLEGAPKEIGRNFNCNNCDSLKDLKGAPEKVGKSFNCCDCKSLKSLEGSPIEIGGSFICYDCKLLKILEGVSKNVKIIK